MKKIFFIFSVALIFLLAGCEQNIVISFLPKEHWKTQAVTDFHSDLLKGIGDTADSVLDKELDIDIPDELTDLRLWIEPAMNLIERSIESQGINFDWRYSGEKLRYRMQGSSFDLITNYVDPAFFNLVKTGDNQYHLTVDYSYFSQEYTLAANLLYDSTVTIKAGKIVDSNANIEKANYAVWKNPTMIDVIFEPGSSVSLSTILFVLLGLGLLVLIIIGISKSGKTKCATCGSSIGKNLENCPNCGSYLK